MIRTTTKSDHQGILAIWEASVRATHAFLQEEDIRYYKALILNELFDAVELRCATDGSAAIQGFIGVADDNIEMLFIAPQSRGTGIGRALLTYAVNQLGATKVDVNEQNPQAIGFYRHMGFEAVGRSEKDGMGKPYPLLHMERKKPTPL